jgi:PAS domain S-box-containing protein
VNKSPAPRAKVAVSRSKPARGPAIPHAEIELSRQPALLAAIVESSDDAIVAKTLEGRVVAWNSGAERIFGYTADEMIGRSITTIIPTELLDEERQILQKLQRGERLDHFETTRLAKDGRRLRVSLTVSPVRDASGIIVGASKIARDIGSQKLAESARAHLAAIVASSEDAIVSKTLAGEIESWNEGATRIFGYTAEEMIGKSITVIIPPELHAQEQEILARVQQGERLEHFDTIRLSKDGRRIPVSLTVSPVRDSRGTIIGASKVARDISERKRTEQALAASERLLSAEADALAKLNEWSTRLWRTRSLDAGWEEVLAATIELLGADMGSIQLLDTTKGPVAEPALIIVAQRGLQQDFLDSFKALSVDSDSVSGRTLRSGARTLVEDIETDRLFEPFRATARAAGFRSLVAMPLIGAGPTPIGVVSAYFRLAHRPTDQELRRLDLYVRQAGDFIQRCRLEQELREREEALREDDRRKNEFLALLAHELRNPLAPIRYALATTKKTGRTAEQQRRAEEIIERQVAHMGCLLDDLLDVSRITRGTLELKKSHIELASVLGAAIEAARPILDAKQHTLSLDLPKHAVGLEADPVRLAQIFSNLLINAAKYTDAGGQVELKAEQGGDEIIVAVRDNGIGITADMMPQLFTLFCQAHRARDRSEGGLGVGLSLVRGLVTLHDGRVEAHSEGANRGSEFIVRLPLGRPAAEIVETGTVADDLKVCAGLKILIVDDNRDAADTCATLLELSGYHVQTAYDGRGALELAERLRPHALLLDIGLPDCSGYEVAEKVRAAPWGRETLLIAVTGWGQGEDKRRAFEAGFSHHLTKPIAAQTVESLLQTLTVEGNRRQPH